ncbi:MAG: PAS domain S-box protein, partial [Smithella sp.]
MGNNRDKSESTADEIRRQAEKRLHEKKEQMPLPRSEESTRRLVHELEVHQIELEMQNAELRQAREELELSRNKYLELYDFAPIGYFTINAQGRIKEVNLTGAKLMGVERQGLINKSFAGFIADSDSKENFLKHCQTVFQKEGEQTCEIPLKKKDGTYFWAHLQSIAQENTEEKAGDIQTMIRDITGLKKAMEKIEHLASFPELNPNPVIETDIKGELIYCNAATVKVLKKLKVPEDGRLFLPRNLPDIIKKLGQEKEGRYELVEIEINGSVFIESIIAPAKLKVVRVYAWDITKRREAEQALRESEKLYRAIGESINYGIWICTPDGRNIYASESFLRLVGLTQKQCSDFGWGDAMDPNDAKRTIALWKKCVKSEENWDIEHRFRGVDGHWHPILARGVPVRNDQGEIIYWAGINLDISQIKQAESDLQKAHDGLEEKVGERTTELQTALSEIKTMKDKLEAENVYFRQEHKKKHQFENIIGQSDGLKYVLYR